MLCYLTLFGWVAFELVSDLAGLSTKKWFSLHCTAFRRFDSICFPHTTLQGLKHFWSSHLSTSLDPNTSTVGSARTWSKTIAVRIRRRKLKSWWTWIFHILKDLTWNLQNLPMGNFVLRSPTTGRSRTSHKSMKSCSQKSLQKVEKAFVSFRKLFLLMKNIAWIAWSVLQSIKTSCGDILANWRKNTFGNKNWDFNTMWSSSVMLW